MNLTDHIIEQFARAQGSWRRNGQRSYWYVAPTGRIIGEVTELLGGGFVAERDGDQKIGRFADLEAAKAAVEGKESRP